MQARQKHIWFGVFAAVFAALAGFVFWGTWSTCACPVMPDSPMTFPEGSAAGRFVRIWMGNGKFIPFDIRHFLGSPYLWQEMQYVLGTFFSAVGLAYYLRGRGLSRIACYGAGLFLAFCGYWLTLFSAGHGGWFHWMLSGVFAFGLADRAVRKNKMKNWVLLGACVAWASFYQPDLWFLFTVFTAFYVIWCCVRERKLPSWKGMAVASVVFFTIAAPSLVGSVQDKKSRDRQIEESKGSALTGGESADSRQARWIFVTNWSLPPAETAEFFIPRLNGDTSCQMVLGLGRQQGSGVRPYTGALGRPVNANAGNYRQHSLYVGWVTCLFALAAVVFCFVGRRTSTQDTGGIDRREVVFFACAAVLFCLLSMGRYVEPLYRLVFALPVGDSIRAPVKWHHLTELCLCVLAGYGIEAVRRRCFEAGLRVCVVQIVLGAVVLFGLCDLARVARLYCAAIDLSIVRSANPAAEYVKANGGGKVADLMEGGSGVVSWSFSTRGIEMTGNPADSGVRYLWIPAQTASQPKVREWIKARNASPVAAFAVTRKAIMQRSLADASANVFLMRLPDVPAEPPKGNPPFPPITYVTWLGVLSLAGTVAASAYGCAKS